MAYTHIGFVNGQYVDADDMNHIEDGISMGATHADENKYHNNFAVATGTDNYVVTISPVPTAYVAGLVVSFKAPNKNTGASTLNCNELGAKAIVKNVDDALASGDIQAGQIITVVYDGTSFQIVSGSGGGGTMLPVYSRVTIGSASASVTIGITNFDKDKDLLQVVANSVYLAGSGLDYTVSADSLTINKVSGTWDAGTIFDFTCFQMSDIASDALGFAVLESTFTAVANGTSVCAIGNSNYNPATDKLKVYYQNLPLFLTDNYTISVDGTTITLVGFTIDIGETIKFEVWKKVRQDLDSTDGSLIQNGSVTDVKLAEDYMKTEGGATNPFVLMPYIGSAPIIESGTNANGNWIKYADGTMIETQNYSFTCDTSVLWGSIYTTGEALPAQPPDFPVPFYSAPKVTKSMASGSTNGWIIGSSTYFGTLTNAGKVQIGRGTSVTGGSFKVDIIAVGRWKA